MRIEPTGEIHVAAPGSQEQPPPPEEPPRRKRRRGLLVGGVVLLLVLALGGASAVPYVSNRLGLPWAPNLPKGDEPSPATVNLALKAPNPSASAPTNSGVAGQLSGPAGNPALAQLTGIVIDPATGSTLWDHSSTSPLTPASATKLLTMSAALLTLDHGMQLSTKVVAGPTPDTVILVPGGDPTLSGLAPGQKSVYPGAAHLDDLVAQVKRSVGGSVRRVEIDTSLFSGDTSAPGWEAGDVPTYAAPIVSGMLDGGLVDATNEGSHHVNDPSAALLQEFARRLGASAGGTTTAPKSGKVLGEVHSAPITETISRLLQLSDNTLAEMIGRQTAIATGAPATFAGVADTTKRVLSQNGFDLSGVQLSDASGLSTQNRAPAKLLAQLLAVAAAPDGKDPRTPKLRALLDGLPVAGGSGTLAGRYGDPASSPGKGWVRAKTGTLSNVNTLAGYVLDADGRVLSFTLMSNGSDQNAGRAALDVVAAALRGCGCR
ncbi:D-alanyl-D-alanine carboxypeptidase/D-alanyl-D-alanine endopeptidase [Amycolatopsis pigmentata]|uniref:D-alanyl-D-alanine carboxypeptidase/D-alanyl-D-alanine-endopeptidase n=1 Tax=Amycolatopsis pigmentata TaxID=450801 RepID=A0ABW5FRA3_9PSEU